MLLKLRTKLSKKFKVTFKKLVLKNGLNTVYGALSLYKYPAKFIPHVVTFVLKNYAKRICFSSLSVNELTKPQD